MGNGAIFAGTAIKILKSILDINGGAQILSSATDPSSSATSAPKGSALLNTSNGNVYIKQDAGSSTNWSALAAPSSTTPTVQRFLSGSGTYTTPASVKYLVITMSGGGGGGAGGQGAAGGHAGTDGADTTWAVHSGSVFATAGKGGGAPNPGAANNGGFGTAGTVSAPGITLIANNGTNGQGTSISGSASVQLCGAMGGANALGGGGSGGPQASTGYAGLANTGGGGGGGGTGTNASSQPGAGGASGAFVKFIVTAPSASYDYSVGGNGTGGIASTGCGAGGDGGAGIIIVEEHYNA